MMPEKVPSQEWKADRYAEHAGFVPVLGESLLEFLKPQPGERILDVGCGDGVLSAKIAETGATVVGVDSAPDMIQAARRRGLEACLMDSTELTFDAEFDAAFSNAALHWMKRDPDAVIRGVRRALRPAGRFVAEMGGHGNIAAVVAALVTVLDRRGVRNAAEISPWYFPTSTEYQAKLECAGFRVESVELFPRPTLIPTDMRGWLETFANPFFQVLPDADRAEVFDEVLELLRPGLCNQAGRWTVDFVRLRFLARVP